MFLVFAVASTGVVCGTYREVSAVEVTSGPIHDGLRDCSDHHSPSAHCDPRLSVFSPGPAVAPLASTGWLVSAVGHRNPLVPAGTADATAPSLHALGISRT